MQIRKDEELRGEILQDVVRCMPENLYFRQPDTQRIMVDILFIFCKLNPDVSYRQGMHEVLAPILWVVERDAIDLGLSSKAMGEDAIINGVFDAEHIEHDTFALFAQVMQTAKNFYEQTTTSGRENPMVVRSRRIFSDLLLQVDERLAKHLESIDVVPQIFLIRWIRLLFGREFAFDGMLTMWDVIFAEDTSLEIVDHICLAMLLRIRWELIEADYNEALGLLLRYPDLDNDFSPQTFVLDAMYLRNHMDRHGGSYLVSKYTGRPLVQAGRPVTPPALQRNITTFSGSNTVVTASKKVSPTRGPRQIRNLQAVLQSTAKNMYAQGEQLGIGKAVRGAVDEVHRRAQEIREAQTPSPPVVRRPGASRASIGPESLHGRVKTLEERSKQLATLLEGAVGELWGYQKLAAERNSTAERQEDSASLEQLSVAIAKVQFVQVYLDDPGLPLPEEARQSDNSLEPDDLSSSAKDLGYTEKEWGLAVNDDEPATKTQSTIEHGSQTLESSQAPDSRSATQIEDLADPSSFEDFSQPSPNPEAQVPQVVIHSDAATSQAGAATTDAQESNAESSSRPRLGQSPFSWMLGEEEKSTRPFSNASPLPPEHNRGKGSLFGDNGDEGRAESKERRGSGKPQKKSGENAVQSEDSFDLGTLRHGIGR